MTTRRVVTGHDADGVSVLVTDGTVPAERDGGDSASSFHKLWSTTATTIEAAEADPALAPFAGLAPAGPGATVIRVVDMPPGVSSPMHRTETIDYGIVTKGTVHLLLDAEETVVGPGDVIVQRGTMHAWANRGEEPAQIVFILIGGTFAPQLREQIDAPAQA